MEKVATRKRGNLTLDELINMAKDQINEGRAFIYATKKN